MKIVSYIVTASVAVLLTSCVAPTAQTQPTSSTYNRVPTTYTTQTNPGAYPTTANTTTTTVQPVINTATTSSGNYTVQQGDTLWKISKAQGTSVKALQTANSMTGTTIYPGQTLRLP